MVWFVNIEHSIICEYRCYEPSLKKRLRLRIQNLLQAVNIDALSCKCRKWYELCGFKCYVLCYDLYIYTDMYIAITFSNVRTKLLFQTVYYINFTGLIWYPISEISMMEHENIWLTNCKSIINEYMTFI